MWYQNKDTGHITDDPNNAESLKVEMKVKVTKKPRGQFYGNKNLKTENK